MKNAKMWAVVRNFDNGVVAFFQNYADANRFGTHRDDVRILRIAFADCSAGKDAVTCNFAL